MTISFDQALQELADLTNNGRVATQQELRELVGKVSVAAQGDVTLLYGGDLSSGAYTGDVVAEMASKESSIRWIQNTDAAAFLKNQMFKQAVADSFHVPLEDKWGQRRFSKNF